jgi:hypothetical protein
VRAAGGSQDWVGAAQRRRDFTRPCAGSGSGCGKLGREMGELAHGAGQRERRPTHETALVGKRVNGLADQVSVGPARLGRKYFINSFNLFQ